MREHIHDTITQTNVMAMGMSTIIAKPSPCYGLHILSSATSNRSSLPSGPSFHPLSGVDRPHGYNNLSFMRQDQRKLRMTVGSRSNNQPIPQQAEASSSSPFPGFPGKGWIIGILLSFFIPFMKNKWGPLTLLKKELDTTLERVEETVEVVEKVAEGVEKMAEQVEEELPKGQLRKAVAAIEHAAEQAETTAHLVEDTIQRVEKLEENFESRIEEEIASRKQTNEKTDASTTKVEQA